MIKKLRFTSAALVLVFQLCSQHCSAQIASAEMQTIAQGLDMCALDTTYYVSPEALNDSSNSLANPAYDYINDQGGTFVLRPEEGFFRPSRVNLLTAFLAWNGPYLTYQPSRTQTAASPYDRGSPLDPWGSPYYMFSPLGLLHGDTGTVTLDLYADNFDRYALVSLGPDGVKSADDVTYIFGSGITGFRVSSVRTATGSLAATDAQQAASSGFTIQAGQSMIVRGVNFGAAQSGAQVLWGSTPLTNITSWSGRQVQLTVPVSLQGTAQLTIQRAASSTNSVVLTITPAPPADVRDWAVY